MNYEYHFHTHPPVSTLFRSIKQLDDVLYFAYDARPRFPFHRVRILGEYRETDVYATMLGITMRQERNKEKENKKERG